MKTCYSFFGYHIHMKTDSVSNIGLFEKYKKTSFFDGIQEKRVPVDGNRIIKSRSVGNYGIHILLGPKIPESIFR